MKKKIIIVVAILIIGLIGGAIFFVADGGLKHYQMNKERINNSTTLSKYIEYHDISYMTVANNNSGAEYYLDFYAQDIKCDLLKDRKILYYSDGFLVLDDYTIYETAFESDKVYSNGQQYKQLDTDIKFNRIQVNLLTPYLISTDNQYYTISRTYENVGVSISIMKANPTSLDKMFLDNNSVVKYSDVTTNEYANTYKSKYVVLKNDGQVYSQEYERKYNSSQSKWEYTLLEEKVLLSTKDYGHITDFTYTTGGNYIGIVRIVSDKGLYYIKQTSEQKYIDIEPTYELVASDIYNKYKSDIKYIDANYVFTTDNNIIETDMLARDIDNEVK